MAQRYSQKVHDYIREHYPGAPCLRLAEDTNRACGTDFTCDRMRAYLKNHHYRTGAPRGNPKGVPLKYPADMEAFVRANAGGRSNRELTELVNAAFGPGTVTPGQMKAFKHDRGISSGLTGRFEKGHPSPTKGKRLEEFLTPEQVERVRDAQFKKGHAPHNKLPVGSVVINSIGYLQKKTAEPDTWRMLHVLIWEAYNGPVPEGCNLVFKDGDRMNCSIDNLMLVTKAEHAIMNRWNLRSADPELTEVGHTVAQLKIAQSKRRRKK